jgi:hypothetical protein
MQLDCVAAGLRRGGNLVFVGRNKSAYENTFFVHSFDDLEQAFFVRDAIEASFGCQLSPFFGDESYLVRLYFFGDFDDGLGHTHFEIQFAGDGFFQQHNIAVVYVATVLAQMDGDTVCTCELALDGGPDRVGLIGSSSLPDGGDVVDIYI